MTIRTRLALQFMLLASLVLGSSLVVVYMLSAAYRAEEFQGRMRSRGMNAAMLLIRMDEVSEALLKRIESSNPVRLPEEQIRIYDRHDHLIFEMGNGDPEPTPIALLERVRREGELDNGRGEREGLIFPFNDEEEGYVVAVSGNDIFGRSKITNLWRVMLATFLSGMLITFIVGRWYARRALTPVSRLVSEMRSIGPAELGHRVTEGPAHDEVAELARSFNALMARLQEAFLAQRNFIANASHEMRTPLATISGQLDVLLLRERDTASYQATLRSVLDDMQNLNRLADRLLMLAQAETGSTATTFLPVRLDEVLWNARNEVQRMDPHYQVMVNIDDVEDERDLTVRGNEVLLRSLVHNLMENACKYSDDQRATVRLSGQGERTRIEVTNTGAGIDQADHERIFEPFLRGNNTGGAKGHGIGLSLARRIAELHGGTIAVRSEDGQGATFILSLPKES